MGNAISRATDEVFLPSDDDVPLASAGAGLSSSQEEDPVRFVSKFFDDFLGHLRKKFQERARGLHRGLPSPFWPFVDSPEPASGTGRCEPVDDPIFLALLQYLIENTLKEGSNYPLSRDMAGVFLCALQGRTRNDDDPVIDADILEVSQKLTSLGHQFRLAGIKWKDALGVDWKDDDAIVPAAYAHDRGRSSLGLTIGIDLGTSYTRAAAETDGSFEFIRNDKGNHTIPSWVAFSLGDVLIGEDAEEQATVNPERTIFNVKRLIGRRFKDKDVQKDMKLVPYEIVEINGKPCVDMKMATFEWWSDIFSPEDIVQIILEKIKEHAENFFCKTIMDAIVTVPAYFNVAQRRATRFACEEAGLNLVAMINEPTAAAIAYSRYEEPDGPKNILVCHLGGGTFDVSILIIDNGAFVVLATNGGKLGGEDIDRTVMRYFIQVIKKKHRKDIRRHKQALAKLRRECERAKRVLSSQQEVQMKIESLCDGLDFSELLTRDLFEELNNDLFMKIVWQVDRTMKDAGLNEDQIDDIVFTGGSSRIPKIRQLLRDYFHGKEPNVDVNPDDGARYGAAIIGGTLSGTGFADTKDILVLDMVHPAAGTGPINTLIHRNLMIPAVESQVIFTSSDDQLSTDDSSLDFEEERDQGCFFARLLLGLVGRCQNYWLSCRWCP